MTHDELMEAIPYAADHGLMVRGVSAQGAFGASLYVFDPTRNAAYYFSSMHSLQMHLVKNTETVRTPETPSKRVRPRPKTA